MNILRAKITEGLVSQTFNLPEDFSLASNFYVGLQTEKQLVAQEIKLIKTVSILL